MNNFCSQCGAPVQPGSDRCSKCGMIFTNQGQPQYANPNQAQNGAYQQPQPGYNNAYSQQYNSDLPEKNKIVAGLFAILLGGFGIHEFYLGRTGYGILMLLFFWSGIPWIIGLIEGIIILCSTDENFGYKYNCRVEKM